MHLKRTAADLLRDLGVEVMPANWPMRLGPCSPPKTNALTTIQGLMDRYGEAHVQTVLQVILLSANHRGDVTKEVVSAFSDLALARRDWFDRAGDLMDALDGISIVDLVRQVRETPGADGKKANRRATLRALLFDRLKDRMEPQKQIGMDLVA